MLEHSSKEAKIRYLDADFQILSAGSYVRCAVTGKPIELEELKYWSVERQEAYLDVETSFKRELELAGS
ncbi:MAG: DUF2093 domain-containing protein [Salaquimonas sp.]